MQLRIVDLKSQNGGNPKNNNSETKLDNDFDIRINKTYINYSNFIDGNGVFASEDINEGDIICICPLLALPKEITTNNILFDYVYQIDENNHALVFGSGSLFNHQNEPSVNYEYSESGKYMIYKALRDINKDEELTISYGDNWFNDRGLQELQQKN